jgi:hypothetical protein
MAFKGAMNAVISERCSRIMQSRSSQSLHAMQDTLWLPTGFNTYRKGYVSEERTLQDVMKSSAMPISPQTHLSYVSVNQ